MGKVCLQPRGPSIRSRFGAFGIISVQGSILKYSVIEMAVLPSPIASNIAEKFKRGGRGFPLRVLVTGPVVIGMLNRAS